MRRGDLLGCATAVLDAPPRGWLRRIWGVADVHARQKWSALWPHLALLPDRGIRLLDAGCGVGTWTFELAAERPEWELVGVDYSRAAIATAERTRQRMGLRNVSFVEADFLAERDLGRFQVVLSVASAHYLAEQGKGSELFSRFREWLEPEGRLFFIGPRRAQDIWFAPWLARPAGHPVFTAGDLTGLCRENALTVDVLTGCIGPLSTIAKQLNWEAQRRSLWLNRLLYPLQWALSAADTRVGNRDDERTMMWLLIAQAQANPRSS